LIQRHFDYLLHDSGRAALPVLFAPLTLVQLAIRVPGHGASADDDRDHIDRRSATNTPVFQFLLLDDDPDERASAGESSLQHVN